MFLSKTALFCAFTLSFSPLAIASASAAPVEKPAYILVSAPLFVDAKTTIPGHTLEPGNYSIRIVDHLKDRYILRVDSTEGKALATFIGLHNPEFDPFVVLRHQGPILWTGAPKGSAAMRGFSFPNGNTLEFVYPKAEAVALAKLNANSVPAIDPESEGRKPDPKLTPEDREVVTLWMLTATRVGPNQETSAIEAKRFAASEEAAQPPTTTQVARNDSPEELAAPQPPPARISKVKAKPVAAKLPQTASELPLLALLSAMMLFAAGSLRLARTRA